MFLPTLSLSETRWYCEHIRELCINCKRQYQGWCECGRLFPRMAIRAYSYSTATAVFDFLLRPIRNRRAWAAQLLRNGAIEQEAGTELLRYRLTDGE